MPATNYYDQASRYLARLDSVGLIRWLFDLSPEEFSFEGWVDTRMIPWPGDPERTCDTVAYLRDPAQGGLPWAVVIEFQAEPDPKMFGRLLVYLGHLWEGVKPSPERGDRFHVARVVVNLTGVGNSAYDMHWPRADLGTTLRRDDENLGKRDAAKELDAIATGHVTRAVLGWIPLMQGGGEDAIIQRWKGLADADPRFRADHGGLALVFAEAAGRGDVWRKALEGWNVVQSKQVTEWQTQAQVRERVSSVLEVLEERFGPPPPDLTTSLRASTDLEALRRWHRLAVKTDSLDQFKRDSGL
jgi:hypothetical protein